ncbi:MAG TPA: copper resistance protein CopC [Candidatus Sulfotelmatobacter sp.]|jgi:methionine-rich copper-binding protein CopC|nr:copper resistance protein CopC [Candidatus Sulfotelmatobacter sp.]
MKRLLLALPLILAVHPAWSHAGLLGAEPADESLLEASPSELVLKFSEKIEPKFSQVTITDASGKRVDGGVIMPDAEHPTWVHVPLNGSAKGRCEVLWRAVSVDTHVTKGNMAFTVK